jgi:hypothetical protein
MSSHSERLRLDLEAINTANSDAQRAAITAEDTLAVIEDREARRALRSVRTGGNIGHA